MKHLFTTTALLFSMTAFAQVGINNTSPKATLDITAKTTDGSKPEGLIIPQLTGDQIRAATTATPTPAYGSNQKGLMIYATAADSAPVGATANITAPGYYYFDGSIWQRILGSSSGDTTNDAWTNDTTNTMVKIGTKADGTARATGTDFIVKDNGYVGIGTTSPKAPLHLSYNNAASAITTSYLTPGLVLTGPSTGSGPGIYFEAQDNNTGTRIMKMHLSKDGSGDGYLNFESVTDNASGVVKKIMALSNNGNVNIDNTFYVDAASNKVGIGTSTPKSYLHVSSPAGQTTPIASFSIVNCGSGCSQGTAKNIVLNNIHTNNSLFGSIDFVPGTDPLGDSGASIQGIDRDATNNYAGLSFFTRNATDYASRLAIKSSGRVGIGAGAESPNATLDVKAITAGNGPEGIIAPRLSLAALQLYTYTSAQTGAIVYVNSASGTPAGQTANVTAAGYYYFDGTNWQKMNGASAGDTTNDAWINDTTNGLVKLGTKADGTARAAGTDFVAKDNGQVGIGTSSPDASAILDIVSTNKGVKFPIASLTSYTDAVTISSPATGLVVYNTTSNAGGPGLAINKGTPASPIWATLSSFSFDYGSTNGKLRYLGNPDNSKILTIANVSFRFTPNGNSFGYDVQMRVNSIPSAFSSLTYRSNRIDFYSNSTIQAEVSLTFSTAEVASGTWKSLSSHGFYSGNHSNLIHVSCDQDPIFIRLSTQERYGTLFSMVADLY